MHFLQHCLICTNRELADLWNIVWASVMWNIWKNRNICVFKNGVFDKMEVLQLARYYVLCIRLESWIKQFTTSIEFSFV